MKVHSYKTYKLKHFGKLLLYHSCHSSEMRRGGKAKLKLRYGINLGRASKIKYFMIFLM